MLIKVTDIKIKGKSFTQPDNIMMYLPARSEDQDLIGWLEDYDDTKQHTYEEALAVYIRGQLLYYNEIDFKMNFVFDKDIQKDSTDEVFIADVADYTYANYVKVFLKIQLPEQVVVDTADLIHQDNSSDDLLDIHSNVFELLMYSLKITVHEVKHLHVAREDF